MKHLILLVVLFSSLNLSAQDTMQLESPKHVYSSYTDVKQTYGLSFYSDGSILYQSDEYDYIKDKKVCNTFKSIEEIKELQSDMIKVLKSKKTITGEKYTIKKGAFSSVEIKIKGIDRTYYFTKYALKLFSKELKKF